jgi:hypothetical protein
MPSIARYRVLLPALVVLIALSGVTAVAAAPPTQASGEFITTSVTFNNSREVGNMTIYDLTATVSYTGTFSGTSVVRGDLSIHADGSAHLNGAETFTGTVDGVPGTLTWKLTLGSTTTGDYHATAVIRSGTGELAGLKGTFHQDGVVFGQGPFGTYAGKVD